VLCYKSLADYAEELTEGTVQIPENFVYYIDYERMGRDMEMSGDILQHRNGLWRSACVLEPLKSKSRRSPRRQIFALVLLAGRQKFAPPILTGLVG